jgi:hypothetical protein
MITFVEGGKLIKIKWVWGRRQHGRGEERFSFIKLETGVSNVIHLELSRKYGVSLRDVKYHSDNAR